MAPDRTPKRGDATLSPARWSRPSSGSILRWVLAAVLSALALGAIYLRELPSSCPAPPVGSAAGTAGAAGDKTGAASNGADPGRSGVPVGGPASAGPAGTGPAPGSPAVRASGPPAGPAGSTASTGAGVPVPAGTVGVPIRLAEPAALTVARPGARVDLLAAPGGDQAGRKPAVLATRVLVLDVLNPGQTDGAASAIYLALRPDQAHRAVGMPESTRFAIIVRS